MRYTYEEKKEARDFLTEVVGINLDHCEPEEMDIEDIKEIRETLSFRLWDVRKKIRKVLSEIYNSIKR